MKCTKTFMTVYVGLMLAMAGFCLSFASWSAPSVKWQGIRILGPALLGIGSFILIISCVLCAINQGRCFPGCSNNKICTPESSVDDASEDSDRQQKNSDMLYDSHQTATAHGANRQTRHYTTEPMYRSHNFNPTTEAPNSAHRAMCNGRLIKSVVQKSNKMYPVNKIYYTPLHTGQPTLFKSDDTSKTITITPSPGMPQDPQNIQKVKIKQEIQNTDLSRPAIFYQSTRI